MQAVDAYAADTSVCLLPDVLGGTVPEASLCGVGTTVAVAAPDGTADAAAHVTLFRYGTIINAHNDVAVPSAWRRSQMSSPHVCPAGTRVGSSSSE